MRSGVDGAGEEVGEKEGGRAAGGDEPDESGEEDDGAEGEVDGDFPSGFFAFAATEHSDHEEGGDECEFVEGVEEEEVEREEGAEGTGSDEEGGGIPQGFAAFGGFASEDGAEEDDDAEEHHNEAEGIGEAEGEMDGGLGEDFNVDAVARSGRPGGCYDEAEKENDAGRGDGGFFRRRAKGDGEGGEEW